MKNVSASIITYDCYKSTNRVFKKYQNYIIDNINEVINHNRSDNINQIISVIDQITCFNELSKKHIMFVDVKLDVYNKTYSQFEEYIRVNLVNAKLSKSQRKVVLTEFPSLACYINNLSITEFETLIRGDITRIKTFNKPTKAQLSEFYSIINTSINRKEFRHICDVYLSYGYYDTKITCLLLKTCYTYNRYGDIPHQLLSVAAKTIKPTDTQYIDSIISLYPEIILYVKKPTTKHIISSYFINSTMPLQLKTLPAGSQYLLGSTCHRLLETSLISDSVKTKIIKNDPELINHINKPSRNQIYAAYNSGYHDAIFLLTNPTKHDINLQVLTKLQR